MAEYAPIASAYLRNAEDMKAARLVCKQLRQPLKALYVGPATGEDFWGWLTMHLNTGSFVNWTAIDRMVEPLDIVLRNSPVPVETQHCSYQDYVGDYDLVVANYCFSHGPKDDVGALAKFNPTLLFCRDHGLRVEALKALFPSYRLYRLPDNTDRYQPHTLAKMHLQLPYPEAI